MIRNFEIIGEAVKHLTKAVTESQPEVPWKQIAGFRDVLIHGYFGVDLEQVWAAIEKDLPVLKEGVNNTMLSAVGH